MAVAYLQEHLLDKGGNLDLDLQNIVGLPKDLVDIVFGAFSALLVCRLLITRTLEIIDTVDRVCQTANTERMELVVSEIESWSWSDKEHFDIQDRERFPETVDFLQEMKLCLGEVYDLLIALETSCETLIAQSKEAVAKAEDAEERHKMYKISVTPLQREPGWRHRYYT